METCLLVESYVWRNGYFFSKAAEARNAMVMWETLWMTGACLARASKGGWGIGEKSL